MYRSSTIWNLSHMQVHSNIIRVVAFILYIYIRALSQFFVSWILTSLVRHMHRSMLQTYTAKLFSEKWDRMVVRQIQRQCLMSRECSVVLSLFHLSIRSLNRFAWIDVYLMSKEGFFTSFFFSPIFICSQDTGKIQCTFFHIWSNIDFFFFFHYSLMFVTFHIICYLWFVTIVVSISI